MRRRRRRRQEDVSQLADTNARQLVDAITSPMQRSLKRPSWTVLRARTVHCVGVNTHFTLRLLRTVRFGSDLFYVTHTWPSCQQSELWCQSCGLHPSLMWPETVMCFTRVDLNHPFSLSFFLPLSLSLLQIVMSNSWVPGSFSETKQ